MGCKNMGYCIQCYLKTEIFAHPFSFCVKVAWECCVNLFYGNFDACKKILQKLFKEIRLSSVEINCQSSF